MEPWGQASPKIVRLEGPIIDDRFETIIARQRAAEERQIALARSLEATHRALSEAVTDLHRSQHDEQVRNLAAVSLWIKSLRHDVEAHHAARERQIAEVHAALAASLTDLRTHLWEAVVASLTLYLRTKWQRFLARHGWARSR